MNRWVAYQMHICIKPFVEQLVDRPDARRWGAERKPPQAITTDGYWSLRSTGLAARVAKTCSPSGLVASRVLDEGAITALAALVIADGVADLAARWGSDARQGEAMATAGARYTTKEEQSARVLRSIDHG